MWHFMETKRTCNVTRVGLLSTPAQSAGGFVTIALDDALSAGALGSHAELPAETTASRNDDRSQGSKVASDNRPLERPRWLGFASLPQRWGGMTRTAPASCGG